MGFVAGTEVPSRVPASHPGEEDVDDHARAQGHSPESSQSEGCGGTDLIE